MNIELQNVLSACLGVAAVAGTAALVAFFARYINDAFNDIFKDR